MNTPRNHGIAITIAAAAALVAAAGAVGCTDTAARAETVPVVAQPPFGSARFESGKALQDRTRTEMSYLREHRADAARESFRHHQLEHGASSPRLR